MSKEEAEAFLERIAAEMGEHFDAVQVMVTWQEEGGCQAVYRGSGNWYARQGMAHEFLENDRAQIAAAEISQVIPITPPEGEEGIA